MHLYKGAFMRINVNVFFMYYQSPARSDDPTCLNDDGKYGPYGDHGWWEQNNGHIDHIFHNTTDNNITVYHNNICNWPRGTDGQQFHPYVEKEETLWIFQTDICRSLFLRYQVSFKQ